MSTSQFVNYSLRPSKSIQRQLAFTGIRALRECLEVSNSIYIGFGSIWFADFVLAHNILNINEMISMEEDETIFNRAVFNAPYASVDVRRGASSNVLPTLYDDEEINTLPWVMWLDYDGAFEEGTADDTRTAIERLPGSSILLITFNGARGKYGRQTRDRVGRLRDLFENVVPHDLERERCDGDEMRETLATLAVDFMSATAAGIRRPGGFVPAFRMIYRDGSDMVTVGGVLPASLDIANVTRQLVEADDWRCMPADPIISPLLTMREAKALQAQLPRPELLTKELVRTLGFDLDEAQIRAYERYYKEYPAFAQIVV